MTTSPAAPDGALVARFPPFVATMPPLLAAYYRRVLPHVVDALNADFPRRGTVAAYAAQLDPLEPWEAEALQRVVFDPCYLYLDRGGKMLRSILTAIVVEAYGADAARCRRVLAAIELMEDSTIMLDDVWDGSEMRRGGPCGHRVVGEESALASGFSVFGHAIAPVLDNHLGLPPEAHARSLDFQSWETLHMTLAQGEEIIWTIEEWEHVGESEYFQETISRCAFLSFRGELHLAGVVAGAPEADLYHLGRYGEYVLMSYHLRGDILDLRPEDADWGKVGGEDITTGRRTAPIIYALDHAEEPARRRLLEIMALRTLDRDLLREAVGIVAATGAFEHTARRAEEMGRRANACLDALAIDAEHRELLRAFTEFTYRRNK